MKFQKILLLLSLGLFSSQALSDSVRSIGFGTGFYISHDGYLVTNYHVIKGGKEIIVRDRFDQQRAANVVNVDVNNDLALLKVEGKDFVFLPVAGSTGVQKGESVFTIGFPHPTLQGIESKVTDGIISSLSGIGGQPNEFQISVPVQPGNSGGPLIDEKGNVVGVIVRKLAHQATLESGGTLPDNINYAVKGNYLLELMATVPAIKRSPVSTQSTQKKLPLTERVAKAEQATMLMIVLSDKPKQQASPSRNNALRSVVLGDLYLAGRGVTQSDTEAIKQYRLAAEQGNALGQQRLGRMYLKGRGVTQSDTEAVKWLRLAAEQGDKDAQNALEAMRKK